jgi:hypothetical protein
MAKAILIALSLTMLNAVSSLLISNHALKQTWKKFNKLVFGSMVIRYFLTAALVWFCLQYLDLHKLAFALTFLVSTFILIFVEILFIHNKSKSFKLKSKD